MLNSKNIRELAYLVTINDITPMNADRLECAHIAGWHCVVGKGEFKPGDIAVFFEIDSKLPDIAPFNEMEFLKSKNYKIKSQKIRGEISQGLLIPISTLGWTIENGIVFDAKHNEHTFDDDSRFLTEQLGVTYAVMEDNVRKANPMDKYKRMAQRNQKFGKTWWWRKLYKTTFGKKILFFLFGRKKDNKSGWPVGKFPGVSKTDQERCENEPWVLSDKSGYIRTQKCDGSSGTYILERLPFNRFEFYVCSRNVRMLQEDQKCFYGEHNYYWEVAKKYNIEEKMKDYLNHNPGISFVCWQGEICAPGIQGNPHGLTETHFYCFHMTDSKNGRFNIREAEKIWKSYNMEVVPIEEEDYILPDDFEVFKLSADGFYDKSVCEGKENCAREGFVYYKVTDPTFSFKNVSREYLLKHHN